MELQIERVSHLVPGRGPGTFSTIFELPDNAELTLMANEERYKQGTTVVKEEWNWGVGQKMKDDLIGGRIRKRAVARTGMGRGNQSTLRRFKNIQTSFFWHPRTQKL